MTFMEVRALVIAGADCFVSRSGYTGEDGFEISVPAAKAESPARKLLEDSNVAPIGLGARDSLRLEAGLCLYGSDLDVRTTPVEAGLAWAIQAAARAGCVKVAFPVLTLSWGNLTPALRAGVSACAPGNARRSAAAARSIQMPACTSGK